jgi:hypothetical protein
MWKIYGTSPQTKGEIRGSAEEKTMYAKTVEMFRWDQLGAQLARQLANEKVGKWKVYASSVSIRAEAFLRPTKATPQRQSSKEQPGMI